jgi:hypothetical protein
LELFNLTPYVADRFLGMDADGLERLVVVVKATYTLEDVPSGGRPRLAATQQPLVVADQYAGEPDASSLLQASEIVATKPSADYAILGCAYPKGGRPAPEALVSVRVGPLRKGLLAIGERVWVKTLGSIGPTAPRPFSRLPLVYERAYGGKDPSTTPAAWWPDNPVGIGFRTKASRLPVDGARLPNLEDPAARFTAPNERTRTVCLSPIPPSWSSRARHAGTFDQRWRRQRMPLPPSDFDARFHHAVPPDQVLPGFLAGGEPIVLAGVRPEGGYGFALPALHPEISIQVGGAREAPPVQCDTLVVDCEAQRLTLVARASLVVQGRVPRLRWIKVQEPGLAQA